MNPYLVLGVPLEADDARIRQAYLDAVKTAPPETHPDRFKQIAAAYEAIRDEPRRIRHEFLGAECPANSPLDAFLRYAPFAPTPPPLSIEALKELLRSCSKS
jgi:curved DNA-binding protein CbpA